MRVAVWIQDISSRDELAALSAWCHRRHHLIVALVHVPEACASLVRMYADGDIEALVVLSCAFLPVPLEVVDTELSRMDDGDPPARTRHHRPRRLR